MAPHSSTFAWKIPWTEEPGRLQSMGSLESDTTERLHFHFSLSCIGEGNGNPLQFSCLENSIDRGAWWATVHGVTELDTTEVDLYRNQKVKISSSWSLPSRNLPSLRVREKDTWLYRWGMNPIKEVDTLERERMMHRTAVLFTGKASECM